MRALTSLLLCAALASVAVGVAPPAGAIDVGAGGDRYSGSGGLLLPAGSDPGTRRDAAGCSDCRWRLSDPCSADGGPCLAVTRGCAQLASLLRIRLSTDGGASWSDRGLVCIPPSGPVTVADVGAELTRAFARLVPGLDPRVQPSAGVVTRIPVNFVSGHPAGLGASDHVLLGHSVRLFPSVRWTWDFGDGSVAQVVEPGADYPVGRIRHAYRRAGVLEASVQARWAGSFEVDGLGPFPVTGVIEQRAGIEIEVGEGRAVLVP